MTIYSAVVNCPEAWEDEGPMIIKWNSWLDENDVNFERDILEEAKLQFAKDVYLVPNSKPMTVEEESKRDKQLIADLNSDAFEVHFLAIFKGDSKIKAGGVKGSYGKWE